MLLGLTSRVALYCVLGTLAFTLIYVSYLFYKKGNSVVNSFRKAVGGLVSFVGVMVCKVGCLVSKAGEYISGHDDAPKA